MKKILDACCGSRMCWFDKDNPDTVFMDCRSEEHTLCDGRRLEIRPDVVGDFRKMPFPDNSFYLVLFDPPHLNNLGESSWLAKNTVASSPHGRMTSGKDSKNVCVFSNRTERSSSNGMSSRYPPRGSSRSSDKSPYSDIRPAKAAKRYGCVS